MQKKHFILSGGGSKEDSFLVDDLFIREIEKTKKRVLYVPIALRRDKIGYEACFDWITGVLSSHSKEFIDISMCLDLRALSLSDIDKFDAIYIGGGNTYFLLNEVKRTEFDNFLTEFLKKGKIVYGGSAGAIILGKSIATVSEEKLAGCADENGLSFLGDFSVRCHFSQEEKNKIDDFTIKYNISVIAIPKGSGLEIINRKASVIGSGNLWIFNPKGGMKEICLGKEFEL